MELRLAHGRKDPKEEMEVWGFEGPILLNVDSMQQMYAMTYTVRFTTVSAANEAQRKTGWLTWDNRTLEILRHGDLIETHEPNAPPHYYADLLLFHREARHEVTAATAHVKRALYSLQQATLSLGRKF